MDSKRRTNWITKLWLKNRGRCSYCGKQTLFIAPMSSKLLATMDHIVPRSKGGRYIIRNILLACRQCNQEKSSLSVAEFLYKKFGHNFGTKPCLKTITTYVLSEGKCWFCHEQTELRSEEPNTLKAILTHGRNSCLICHCRYANSASLYESVYGEGMYYADHR